MSHHHHHHEGEQQREIREEQREIQAMEAQMAAQQQGMMGGPGMMPPQSYGGGGYGGMPPQGMGGPGMAPMGGMAMGGPSAPQAPEAGTDAPLHTDTLYPGQQLRDDNAMRSRNETYHAVCKKDGNFVLTHGHWYGGRTLWQTNTHEKGAKPNRVLLRSDGNLVIYDSYNNILWETRTHEAGAAPPVRLVLENDGNLVIMDAYNQVKWSTNTAGM